MKRAQTLATVIAMVAMTGSAFAQGSLTPPGAPGTTMKTLEQVEPRTPISGAYTISQSGSYYLTGNSNGRIDIQADNVTLDLMGFHIVSSSRQAILISGAIDNTRIHNGTLSPSANYSALYAPTANNCRFENLRINGNNIAGGGIRVNDNSVVRNCDVKNCITYGIQAGDKTEIRDCRVNGITNDGIKVENGCRIIDNVIEDNGDDGIYISGSKNYLSGNIVKGNGDNYDIVAGNQLNILLCEIPETLDWPCSVKLAGTLTCVSNLVNGITVAANDVTIDMDGHTLIGSGASSGSGIYQSDSFRNLRVCNGKVTGWHGNDKTGIYAYGKCSILSDLQAFGNYHGIRIGDASLLGNCAAYTNIFNGIYAGNDSAITDCTASENGDGIKTGDGCTITDCTASENGNIIAGHGIKTGHGCTISGCITKYNRIGIYVSTMCRVTNCTCNDNELSGIYLMFGNNRIDGNNVIGNSSGINAHNGGNFIVRNTASNNTTNYDITGTQTIGPIITSTGTIVSESPWANFSF